MKVLILVVGRMLLYCLIFFKKYNIRTSIAVRNLSSNSIKNWAEVFECKF